MAQLNLNTPTTTTTSKLLVLEFHVSRSGGYIIVESQDSLSNPITVTRYDVPDSTNFPGNTLAAFITAIGSARAGESGGVGNRMNYRILGFLMDSGELTGVTLVP